MERITPAKHPNSDIIRTFLETIGWEDSETILSGFCKGSKRILKGFCEDSGRLLEESGRILMILGGFRKESGRIVTGFWEVQRFLVGFR